MLSVKYITQKRPNVVRRGETWIECYYAQYMVEYIK